MYVCVYLFIYECIYIYIYALRKFCTSMNKGHQQHNTVSIVDHQLYNTKEIEFNFKLLKFNLI